jgi:hypothetical protein
MPTTAWATAYLRPNTDKGSNQWWKTLSSGTHYEHVNQSPYAGALLTAYQSGLVEEFDLSSADPSVSGPVTAITNRIRIYTISIGVATTVGLQLILYNDTTEIGRKSYEWASNVTSQTNYDCTFSGLSIDVADLANLNIRIASQGTGWGPLQGFLVLTEVDHTVTYRYQTAYLYALDVQLTGPGDSEKTITADASTEKTITADASTEKTITADASTEKTITADASTEKTITADTSTEKTMP